MSKPKIRFKNFNDDWEQRKLSELATMHARIGWQNLRTSEFLNSGEYMLITGTDFEDGTINYSTCHYVKKERYDQDKNIQIHNGSILITKDGTLGKVAYVQGLTMPATLNAGIFNVEIINKNDTDEKYLFQYLKAPFLMNYVAQKATGGTIKHLNQNILVDFPILIPALKEQKKIGNYFRILDNLITLHQREVDNTKKLKKFMLQNMFPQNGESVPKIRFKGFTDDWEQRKLGDIANNTYGGGTPKTSVDKYWIGEIPWIQSSDITEHQIYNVIPKKHISQEAVNNSATKLVPKNSIAIVTRVGVGKLAIMLFSYTTSQDFLSLSNLKTNIDFTAYALYKKLQSELNSVQGTSIKGITKEVLLSKEVMIPKYAEQTEIGSYFRTLDNLITLHQQKCDELQNLKKFMLQTMFV